MRLSCLVQNLESQLERRLTEAVEKALMEVAPDYEEALLDNGFISPPAVRLISSEVARGYFLDNSMRGQLKMKNAFRSRDEFSEFAENLLSVSV